MAPYLSSVFDVFSYNEHIKMYAVCMLATSHVARHSIYLARVPAAANLAYRFRFALIAPSDHCYIVIGSVAF